ncbi:glycosyltransferase family 2 protein [Tindallia californiensis]|uniref:Glycosyltransferase 2-like domain-containing protein n=1 Tax=Tindallia californiensis TaxID=159292 RepID=A0A1H3PD19_9FIRM|nr:glycosyltransferase family 2 protein [Tindallia californiensis]SDY98967.1 hypothetical protein SAMN05192546_106146 [Tindallia californiensis]
MSKIDLSLAIVTYNNEDLIENTARNIIESIPPNHTYKLYIIDNNSKDNTVKIARKVSGNIEIVCRNENKGFGNGHNAIIGDINSKYHFVINPDITIENANQVQSMIRFLDDNPEVGLLSPLVLNTDGTIQHLCKINPTVLDMMIRRISPNLLRKRQDKYVMKNTGYNSSMQLEYATGSFMVFRTNIFKQINGFDDAFFLYLEDADITRRVNQVSKTMFFPEARVIHIWERNAHKSLKYVYITLRSMITYFNKWGWKFM